MGHQDHRGSAPTYPLEYRVRNKHTVSGYFVFSPLFRVIGSLFSLPPPPAFSYHSLTLYTSLTVQLSQCSLHSRTNSTTTQLLVLLQFFYLNQQHYSTAPGFQSFFYNHSLDIQLGKSFFSLIAKPSALLHSSWFSPFYEIFLPRGFITNFTLSSNHQHYRTASGFF